MSRQTFHVGQLPRALQKQRPREIAHGRRVVSRRLAFVAGWSLVAGATLATAQTVQSKLTTSGGTTRSFGAAVDIGYDLSRENVIVGAPRTNDHQGRFTVYSETSPGTWATTLDQSSFPADSRVGTSVAVYKRLLAIGAPGDGLNVGGTVLVFRESAAGSGVWVAEASLVSPSPAAGKQFGASVDISGTLMAVGEPKGGADGYGVVYVYHRISYFQIGQPGQSSEKWVREATLTSGGGSWNPDASLGLSVGITAVSGGATRNAVIAGAPHQDQRGEDAGEADIWVKSGGNWVVNAQVKPDFDNPGALFGYSVAIDGDNAVVGSPKLYAPSMGQYGGVAEFLSWDGDSYDDAGQWLSPVANDNLGTSVAISGDRAILGIPGFNATGKDFGGVWIVKRTNGLWDSVATSSFTYPTDLDDGDAYGVGVAILGLRAIAGSPEQSIGAPAFDAGAAYVLDVP